MSKKVRVWKLGSLEHNIVPRPKAVKKLKKILKKILKKGSKTSDIIWGPDLEVVEIKL